MANMCASGLSQARDSETHARASARGGWPNYTVTSVRVVTGISVGFMYGVGI